jgi:mRNA-degrading endonuclease RelE of RelBE toxin-antitoxin system
MQEGDGKDEIADEVSSNIKRELPSLHRLQYRETVSTLKNRISKRRERESKGKERTGTYSITMKIDSADCVVK